MQEGDKINGCKTALCQGEFEFEAEISSVKREAFYLVLDKPSPENINKGTPLIKFLIIES
jgi:hypothetical protein